jgi:hypothetical protein
LDAEIFLRRGHARNDAGRDHRRHDALANGPWNRAVSRSAQGVAVRPLMARLSLLSFDQRS